MSLYLQILVVKSTTLIASLKIDLHSITIICKFQFPSIDPFDWFVVESTRVENFGTEFNQSIESLKRVSWWYLLFSCWCKTGEADRWEFHFGNVFDFLLLSSLIRIEAGSLAYNGLRMSENSAIMRQWNWPTSIIVLKYWEEDSRLKGWFERIAVRETKE